MPRRHGDAVLQRGVVHLHRIDALRQLHPQHIASRRARRGGAVREEPAHRGGHDVGLLRIGLAHPPQVEVVAVVLQELGNRQLRNGGRGQRVEELEPFHRLAVAAR
ncbi:hypothetical protein D3C72_2051380 [compost metagenome]